MNSELELILFISLSLEGFSRMMSSIWVRDFFLWDIYVLHLKLVNTDNTCGMYILVMV